jgi:hypothetical protein
MSQARTVITSVEPLEGRWLRLSFADGAVHEVDLTELLERGGVFESLAVDDRAFADVRVDTDAGTISWPGGVDLDPDVLRGDQPPAGGTSLPRKVVAHA